MREEKSYGSLWNLLEALESSKSHVKNNLRDDCTVSVLGTCFEKRNVPILCLLPAFFSTHNLNKETDNRNGKKDEGEDRKKCEQRQRQSQKWRKTENDRKRCTIVNKRKGQKKRKRECTR